MLVDSPTTKSILSHTKEKLTSHIYKAHSIVDNSNSANQNQILNIFDIHFKAVPVSNKIHFIFDQVINENYYFDSSMHKDI